MKLKTPILFPLRWRVIVPMLLTVLALMLPSNLFATVEIYNTVTSFNWVCPAGVTNLQVECWGGGGAGGGASYQGSANAGGGGGGGGAYAMLTHVPVTPGNSYNITIPPAATCPSGFTNNQRNAGSAVSFTGDGGINVTAAGGAGGQCRIVTGSSASTGASGAGGAAGVGYDAAWSGGTTAGWTGGNASGGGGGAGDLSDGGGAASANGSVGAGGLGSDADHTGGNGGGAKNGAGVGAAGSTPGGGGGGGKATSSNIGPNVGGKGGLGQIILTYTSSIPPVPTMSQVYNTATNYAWVCPAGVTNLQVECWGGGGGGGSSLTDTNAGGSQNAGGGGGGGGAYAKLTNVPVTPGNSYNITIPAAAIPSTTGFTNNQRYDGSAVSFTGDSAITVTADGGQGGQCTIVTGSTATSGQPGAGAAAGTGYDVAWAGGDATYWSSGNGGGGGGGAGDLAAGGSPLASNGSFGAGGTGSDPNHKGGDGGAARNGASAGNSASSPGGGGGGAKSTPTSPGPNAGGAGGLGQIILTWEIPSISNVAKADNTTDLNLGTSWVGGVAPTASTIAKWDSTVTAANATVLGADVSWAGIAIADPAGLVTINAGNTLTLGGVSTNIDMSAATADLTLNCGLSLGSANVWDVQSGRTLTVGGAISGPGSLALQNAGTVVLSSGANDYAGDTTVGTNTTLLLGAANIMPNGGGKGIVTVDGALDLNTHSETLNGLSGAGTVDTVAGGTPTLTLGAGDGSGTFTGVIQNSAGTLSLTKTGTNRQDLVGANTFSGPVQINQGWLAVGDNNAPLANVSSITVADGATFGAYGTEVDVNSPVTLGAGNPTINIAACVAPLTGGANTTQRPLRLNAGITGTGNVVFEGVNPFNWTGAINVNNCTYTGSTLITCLGQLPGIANTNNDNVVVGLLGDDALPTSTVVTIDGNIGVGSGRFCDLNLNGHNQTLAGLSNIPQDLRNQRVVNSGAAATLTVNNSADYEFSGFMGATSGGSNPGDNLSLVKSGSGTFTLSKANGNTYANGTTINGGTLLVNNLTGSGTGTGDVTVNSGGTLGGTGSIAGNVLVNAGGGIAPGASIGTLTVNGALTLSADSTNVFEVDGTLSTNDAVVLGSTVAYGGVLEIVPSGSFTVGQTFTLFSGLGATDPSNFASVTSTGSATFSFTNGVLTVVSAGGPSGPGTITNSISGNTLTLTWPAGQSWRLVGQTNNLSAGLNASPGAWFDVPGGVDGSNSITIDHANPAVFYKLVSP